MTVYLQYKKQIKMTQEMINKFNNVKDYYLRIGFSESPKSNTGICYIDILGRLHELEINLHHPEYICYWSITTANRRHVYCGPDVHCKRVKLIEVYRHKLDNIRINNVY